VAPLRAQTATVTSEENFRAQPDGTILARVRPGTILSVSGADGRWVHATLDGWIWTPSLEEASGSDMDLRVSADEGENLRIEPQGTILAEVRKGMLFREVERKAGWIHVRRTGWIWKPSVTLADGADADATPSVSPRKLVTSWSAAGGGGAAILSAPNGDTLARTRPGTDLQVLGRRGRWARVRLEGWTWIPPSDSSAVPDSAVLTGVTPAQVAADPDRYRGRVVAWNLQYVSQEKAEKIRADFYEGEPYLLTRFPGDTDRFVYVAVPPERLDQLGVLTPLERIAVVGRIRTGSAALTGGPILDLMELRRGGGASASGGAGVSGGP